MTLYILGGGGDLVRRMLLPGVAGYLSENRDDEIHVVGSGRSEIEDYPQLVRESLTEAGAEFDESVVENLAESSSYLVADATDPGELQRLLDSREAGERSVLYFALAPAVTADAVDALSRVELPEGIVLAMEKPFGEDADSADELNDKLLRVTDEDHIFRIDHFNYESAQSNLTGLIGANALFSAGWDNSEIESVEINFEESLGLEGRAGFYDSNGAVRDMLQSHLLQTMAHSLAAGTPESATEILAATSIDPESVRRARYLAGEAGGQRLPDYAEEEGVDPERGTETLFQVTAQADTERWRGVPVTLRSGKAIGDPAQEIVVNYRRRGAENEPSALPGTRLSFPFNNEVAITVNVSDHGYSRNHRRVTLREELMPSRLSPYGRLVGAIAAGDHSSEVPADTPRLSWQIVEPVLAAFARNEVPLEEYRAGSKGPENW